MNYNRHSILNLAAFGAVLLTFHISVASGALPPTDADCAGPDPFGDPDDCTGYYQCFNIPSMGWVLIHTSCPPGGYYDANDMSCKPGDCPVVTTTSQPTTTPPGPPAFTCTSAGLFADPIVPRKYYHCILIGTQFYHHVY